MPSHSHAHRHDEDELERQRELLRNRADQGSEGPTHAMGPEAVLRLQRTAGNAAVGAMINGPVVQREPEDEKFDPADNPFTNPPAIKPTDDSIGNLVFELREQEDKDAPTGLTRPTASLDASSENLKAMSRFAQQTVVYYGAKYGSDEPGDASKTGWLEAAKQQMKDFFTGGDTNRLVSKTASTNQKQVDNASVVASLLRSSLGSWLSMIDSSNSAWGLTRMQAKECNIDFVATELPKDDPRRLAGLGGGATPGGPTHLDSDQIKEAGNQIGKDAKNTNFKQAVDNTSFLQAQRNHREKSDLARTKQRAASQSLFEGATKANAEMTKAEDDKKSDWKTYKLALDTAITAVEVGASAGAGVAMPEGHGSDQLTNLGKGIDPRTEAGGLDYKKLADWGVGGLKGALDEKIASIDRNIAKLKEVQANRSSVISAQREIAIVEEYEIALKAERDALTTLDEEGQKMMSALQEYGGALGQASEDKGLTPKGFSTNEADMMMLGRIRQSLGLTLLAQNPSVLNYVAELRNSLAPLAGMTDGPWPALVAAEGARCAQIEGVVAEANRLLAQRMAHLTAIQNAFVSGMAGAGGVNKPY